MGEKVSGYDAKIAIVVEAATGRRDVRIGTIPARTYDLLLSEIRAN